MTIQLLPSGRYRARVWMGGEDVPVARVIGGRRSFETYGEAERACEKARRVLYELGYPVHARRGSGVKAWSVAAKGESRCRSCGEMAIHLHHIVPTSIYPGGLDELEGNGLPLCGSCHSRWHDRLIEIPHTLLSDVEFRYACDSMGAVWVGRHYYDFEMPAERRFAEMVERSV